MSSANNPGEDVSGVDVSDGDRRAAWTPNLSAAEVDALPAAAGDVLRGAVRYSRLEEAPAVVSTPTPEPTDTERTERRVRGIVILDGVYEATLDGAQESWRGLLDEMVESCPPMYCFVSPSQPVPMVHGLSQRQFLMGAAVEYLEMEYHDGVPLPASHRQRLERLLAGEALPEDHPVQGGYRIPADRADGWAAP